MQPNIASYLSIMSESANTRNSADIASIHGASPQNPVLPSHLVSNSLANSNLPSINSGVQVPPLTHSAAVPPPDGLLPSAPPIPPIPPPPTNYKLTDRKIIYPPNFKHGITQSSTNFISAKSSPHVPDKKNPVVLLRVKDAPFMSPIHTPQSPTRDNNSNSNNGNHEQEANLFMEFETIPHPSDPFLFVSSVSAPNLLLDIDNSPSHRLTPNSTQNSKRDIIKSEENLIEFTEIKPINTDDIYDELFSETRLTSPLTASNSAFAQQNGSKNQIL